MASTTSIQSLLQAKNFDLVINETTYRVTPPSLDDSSSSIECLSGALSEEQVKRMGDVRLLVGQLYEVCTQKNMARCTLGRIRIAKNI